MSGDNFDMIPLRRSDGTVRAYALVNLDDLRWLVKYRWHFMGNGYARRQISFAGRQLPVSMHREIMGLLPGDSREVDHINGDKLDNRRANLRIVTHAQNNQNVPSYTGARSKHRGVSWDRESGKWRATAIVAGARHDLGRFVREEDAAKAAIDFRRTAMPFAVEGR